MAVMNIHERSKILRERLHAAAARAGTTLEDALAAGGPLGNRFKEAATVAGVALSDLVKDESHGQMTINNRRKGLSGEQADAAGSKKKRRKKCGRRQVADEAADADGGGQALEALPPGASECGRRQDADEEADAVGGGQALEALPPEASPSCGRRHGADEEADAVGGGQALEALPPGASCHHGDTEASDVDLAGGSCCDGGVSALEAQPPQALASQCEHGEVGMGGSAEQLVAYDDGGADAQYCGVDDDTQPNIDGEPLHDDDLHVVGGKASLDGLLGTPDSNKTLAQQTSPPSETRDHEAKRKKHQGLFFSSVRVSTIMPSKHLF